jgi:hypothetical protein
MPFMSIWVIEISPGCPTRSVYPSGAARATLWAALVPLAPGRFSTFTG